MATSRLNLTRDQLASFLQDHEQIKQFERLFADVSQLEPTTLNDLALAAGTADQKAVEALSLIASVAQEAAVSSAVADGKATQALAQVQALADIVQGLQVVPPPREFKRSRYGSFYNMTTLTPAAINTAYGMTFDTTDISRGVYIGSPTSRIYVDETSLYDFQFSAQIDNTSGGNHLIWIWVRKNGVNIADSAGEIAIKGNDGELVPSWNYFIELVAGDYVEIMYSVSDTAVQIVSRPAAAPVPAIPSVILTVSNNILGVQ